MMSVSISSTVSVSLSAKHGMMSVSISSSGYRHHLVSIERFTETLDEIDTDIIQCFVDRLTETPNEIDRDII
jgi:hypothetical protein